MKVPKFAQKEIIEYLKAKNVESIRKVYFDYYIGKSSKKSKCKKGKKK